MTTSRFVKFLTKYPQKTEQIDGHWNEVIHFELEGYQDFLLLAQQFGCHPADLLMTNDSLCVDEKGFRNSINSIIQGNGSRRVI